MTQTVAGATIVLYITFCMTLFVVFGWNKIDIFNVIMFIQEAMMRVLPSLQILDVAEFEAVPLKVLSFRTDEGCFAIELHPGEPGWEIQTTTAVACEAHDQSAGARHETK